MLTSPDTIKLPEDLKIDISNAENRLIMLRKEEDRIVGNYNSFSKGLVEKEKRLIWLTETLEQKEKALSFLEDTIKTSQEKLFGIQTLHTETQSKTKEIEKTISAKSDELTKKDHDIKTRHENLSKRENDFSARMLVHESEKESFNHKKAILREALEKL